MAISIRSAPAQQFRGQRIGNHEVEGDRFFQPAIGAVDRHCQNPPQGTGTDGKRPKIRRETRQVVFHLVIFEGDDGCQQLHVAGEHLRLKFLAEVSSEQGNDDGERDDGS